MNSKRVDKCTLEELKPKLKYIFKLIGLVKIPDEFEKKVIIDFIIHDLKKFRLDEFVLAFKMAVKGELFLNNKPLDVDHYHNFSVKYLCEVMQAYENSERRHKHLQGEKLKELPQHAQKSESEKQQAINEDIEGAFQFYKKNNKMPLVCSWMYTELENSGRLVHSLEFKKKIYSQAKDVLKSRLKAQQSNSDGFSIKDIAKRLENLEDDGELKSVARELALKHYWDEQIKSE